MSTGADSRDGSGVTAPVSDGWNVLAADWRAQATAKIDVEGLRREVVRRGRRLRWMMGAEVLLTTVVIGMCVWATLLVERPLFSPTGSLVVIACVLGVQGWSLWIRRRQVRDSGLNVRALLALERDRIRTSRLYWRVNVWLAVALWCVLFGVLMQGLVVPADDGGSGMSLRQAMASLLVNAPVTLGFATFAWWWCGRGRKRLQRLQALQNALDAD
ncbi:hypothetical protein [Lysobacter sp. A421]